MSRAKGCGYLFRLVSVLKLMVLMDAQISDILKAMETVRFKWMNL